MDSEAKIDKHREKLNHFCYMCGKFTIENHKHRLIGDLECAYTYYFQRPVFHYVPWAPNHICNVCSTSLERWWKKQSHKLSFAIPMVWSDPGVHHSENCYVCANKMVFFHRKKSKKFAYRGVPSALLPVPHNNDVEELRVPKHPNEVNISKYL